MIQTEATTKLEANIVGRVFPRFDDRGLEFPYQEYTRDGKISRFNKFVHAGTEREQD